MRRKITVSDEQNDLFNYSPSVFWIHFVISTVITRLYDGGEQLSIDLGGNNFFCGDIHEIKDDELISSLPPGFTFISNGNVLQPQQISKDLVMMGEDFHTFFMNDDRKVYELNRKSEFCV